MDFKNYKKTLTQKRAQSVIEYALLVTMSIIALIVAGNFVSRLKHNSFESHFKIASFYIGGNDPDVSP